MKETIPLKLQPLCHSSIIVSSANKKGKGKVVRVIS
jgi:hypothetical protein